MIAISVRASFALGIVLYPTLVYFGLVYVDARVIGIVLLLLGAARLVLLRRDIRFSPAFPVLLLSTVAVLLIGSMALLSGTSSPLRLYPVCVNGLMLMLFGASLLRPPSMVERMARLWDPNLPDSAIGYTRRVTQLWCVFFALNGSVALVTAVAADLDVWALYNGVVSYVFMGLLFAGEYLVRRRVMKRNPSPVAVR